jgi:hypothetical protein
MTWEDSRVTPSHPKSRDYIVRASPTQFWASRSTQLIISTVKSSDYNTLILSCLLSVYVKSPYRTPRDYITWSTTVSRNIVLGRDKGDVHRTYICSCFRICIVILAFICSYFSICIVILAFICSYFSVCIHFSIYTFILAFKHLF